MSESKSSPDRPRLVLGTAGHIDHGKTTLVQALTGVNTDRLPEEQRRGITIELGFAPLDLGEIQLGVVDVPGHEKFVRTMVSGASGIDIVLLVVAADEGVMPQTREHIAVCDLLGVDSGIVALTKCDLADPDLADLAEIEISELLETTSLSGAECIRVSARSGAGVPELRSALLRLAHGASTRTRRDGPSRLSVDRVFSARGFGSVVTGTLTGAALRLGEEVVLLPDGPSGRIRGLQSFSEVTERAAPGTRCAVNIQGIERTAVSRGMVVARPGELRAVSTFDAEIDWLPEAPEIAKPTGIAVLSGTAERNARLAPLGGGPLKPGSRRFARFHVEGDPLILLPEDRIIIRGFSRTAYGGATLGGGRVIDTMPARRRPGDPQLVLELERLRDGTRRDGLRLRIERYGYAGAPEEELGYALGLSGSAVREELESEGDALARSTHGLWYSAAVIARFAETLLAAVRDFHRSEPIRPGIPQQTLAAALPENAGDGAFALALERLIAARQLEIEDGLVSDPEHLPMLSQREEAILAHIRAEAMTREFEPPTFREWLDMFGIEERELRELLAYLEREGALTRAPSDLWFDRVAVDTLRKRVRELLSERGEIDTPTYKDLIGTTRKFAVPLMELFDAERITVRRGDVRVAGQAK
ncbi:MAG: selenocysteine-specific translation elongation factor [Myxococcales bacterium]|nr:selenocysteine-specific translation elongation factor [Myxococcales bacterium]